MCLIFEDVSTFEEFFLIWQPWPEEVASESENSESNSHRNIDGSMHIAPKQCIHNIERMWCESEDLQARWPKVMIGWNFWTMDDDANICKAEHVSLHILYWTVNTESQRVCVSASLQRPFTIHIISQTSCLKDTPWTTGSTSIFDEHISWQV